MKIFEGYMDDHLFFLSTVESVFLLLKNVYFLLEKLIDLRHRFSLVRVSDLQVESAYFFLEQSIDLWICFSLVRVNDLQLDFFLL